MTKTELIAKIRTACIDANPDILKLQFGCRIKDAYSDLIITGKRFEGWYVCSVFGTISSNTWIDDTQIKEVIGRDLELTDILLMVEENSEYSLRDDVIEDVKWRYCLVDEIGIQYTVQEVIIGLWNLELPFEEQELPVLEYIYSLIP